jgi:hypothetical protein
MPIKLPFFCLSKLFNFCLPFSIAHSLPPSHRGTWKWIIGAAEEKFSRHDVLSREKLIHQAFKVLEVCVRFPVVRELRVRYKLWQESFSDGKIAFHLAHAPPFDYDGLTQISR